MTLLIFYFLTVTEHNVFGDFAKDFRIIIDTSASTVQTVIKLEPTTFATSGYKY